MSEFLKFAYELLSQVVYNLVQWGVAFVKLFVTGWAEYFLIFKTYFADLSIAGKILSVLLMIILIAIPVTIIILIVKRAVLRHRLKTDTADNSVLYREIGRLNKQVLSLMEEKNSILALKVNAMGGTKRIPYMGASAIIDDELPTVGNVTNADGSNGEVAATGEGASAEGVALPAMGAGGKAPVLQAILTEDKKNIPHRFPKLSLVDDKYTTYEYPEFDNDISLEDFAEGYRLFAASQMHLYYTPEIVRRFVAGMAASKLLILEGISGTGKTSLPYSFSRYLNNPATIVSVQPSFRDRSELLGYFNEFSKKFNETEFLRALYEANYRQEPTLIVLDEMNLARIEYYFAEMLSVLEMPSKDEWVLDLVPTAWDGDPVKMDGGKIHVPDSTWFVGTANNDDSTFTITDKVYDRAMPIELNERADAFECEPHPKSIVTTEHLQYLFQKAKVDHPISDELLENMQKLDQYLITRFKLSFGNRIMKHMYDFIPVYVACGGTELDAMDYIVARKVLKKFESMNVTFVRDEISGLISYIEKTFGETGMIDSKDYLRRIQNMY
ncbi:MAG: AAA family ATPase [Lachnoclostridium sp.]|nr:AAA family ATPase [Lachnoclostridium sp.]